MSEFQPQNPELEIPANWPDIDIIRELKNKRWINQCSPQWWSTDYAIDPREYLNIGEFKKRLIHLGNCNIQQWSKFLDHDIVQKDVYLYPYPDVPITILNIPVNDLNLPFLLTARPYHPKEIYFGGVGSFISDHPVETLEEFAAAGGKLELLNHFYPHIRGLFAGKRGNHYF